MVKSKFVEGLDLIQAEVNLVLKPIGFSKSGRTHNRLTSGGLTHVLDFQKEKFVTERRMFPRVWKKSYGKFAINLGVYLPCVSAAEFPKKSSEETIMEYECTIRQRLGSLVCKFDRWFEITDSNAEQAKQIVGLVRSHALKFFDRFQSYQDVLANHKEHGRFSDLQTIGRADLEAALIANHLGDKNLALALFQKAYTAKHEGFRKHVRKLATQAGYSIG